MAHLVGGRTDVTVSDHLSLNSVDCFGMFYGNCSRFEGDAMQVYKARERFLPSHVTR
ncbi:hypothetical protein L195_g051187, partial [Trifolium pratense]